MIILATLIALFVGSVESAVNAPPSQIAAIQDSRPTTRPKLDPYRDLAKVLKAHVKTTGVDYAGLKKSSQKELDRFLNSVKTKDTKTLKTSEERIAFYVNAYNAWILRRVIDLPASKKSVLDVKGFFDQKTVKVASRSLTLNKLEELARKEGDPRVHFVVNCASASCPPLLGEPLRAKTLNKQLKAATEAYLMDAKHGLKVTSKKEVKVSKIFEWYAKDFAKSGSKSAVWAWIKKNAASAQRKKLATITQLNYLNYDWKLNRAK